MKKKTLVLRGIDALAFAAGIPLAPLATKLYEEISDSDIAFLVAMSEAEALERGHALVHLRNGLMSIQNFFTVEISEARRKRQLYRSAEEFEKAFFTLRRHPLYTDYAVKAACFASGAQMLLKHTNLAKDWLVTAETLNEKLGSPETSEKIRGYLAQIANNEANVTTDSATSN